jgi:hypothetical protein
MPRKRAVSGTRPGAISRRSFPNRALDHGKRLSALYAFLERLVSNSSGAHFHYGKFIAFCIPGMRQTDCCRAQDAWRIQPENRTL